MNNFTKVKQILNNFRNKVDARKVLVCSLMSIFVIFYSIRCFNQIKLLTQDNIHSLTHINIEVTHKTENGPYINTLTYTFLNSNNEEEEHVEENWDNTKSVSHVYYLDASKESYVELNEEETNIYVGSDMAKGMLQFNYNTRQE